MGIDLTISIHLKENKHLNTGCLLKNTIVRYKPLLACAQTGSTLSKNFYHAIRHLTSTSSCCCVYIY